MLMKRTFTSILLLLTTVFTALNISAQSVQSSDRDKISSVVMNALGKWDSQAYQNAASVIMQAADYDMSSLPLAAMQSLLGMRQPIEGTSNYQILFSAKAVTGHFAVADGAWYQESEASDLQFSFNDRNGVPVVLKMVPSQESKTTMLPVDVSELMGDMDGSIIGSVLGGGSEDEDGLGAVVAAFLQDVTTVGVDLSRRIDITLTYGGTTMMSGTVEADLNSVGQTFLEGIKGSSSLKFYKGVLETGKQSGGFFELMLVNSGYKPGEGVTVNFTAQNESTKLVSLKLNAPGTYTPMDAAARAAAANAPETIRMDYGFESLNIDLDIMGQAQVKGNIASINDFVMAATALDYDDPAAMQTALADINKQLDVNLYYDGSSTPAAKLQIIPSYDADWDEWDASAGIVFLSDNSSYPLGEFFTTENFPEVAQGVATIAGEVSELVETIREKASEIVDGGTESVKTIASSSAAPTAYYTLDGKLTTASAKGLKIVKMSDGRVKKLFVK